MARLSLIALLATGLSVLQTASAHFQLVYPPTRGFDHDKEDVSPCGNFNSVGNRTQFPLQDGFVQITSGHTSYSYEVKLVTGNNPQTQDYNSSAVTVAQGQIDHPEGACLPLNIANNTQSGTNATLQVIFNGGDGALYQCTDITLVSNPSNFNSSACVNSDGSSSNSTSNAVGPAAVTAGLVAVTAFVSGVLAF